jgi:hypothetical protein
MTITRLRAALAAIAICWLLAACGSGSGSADPAAAGNGPPAAGAGSGTADSKATQATGGDAAWCAAWKAVGLAMTELTAAMNERYATPKGEGPADAKVAAAADTVRARLAELMAATPPEVKADTEIVYRNWLAVADRVARQARGNSASEPLVPSGTSSEVDEAVKRLGPYTAKC